MQLAHLSAVDLLSCLHEPAGYKHEAPLGGQLDSLYLLPCSVLGIASRISGKLPKQVAAIPIQGGVIKMGHRRGWQMLSVTSVCGHDAPNLPAHSVPFRVMSLLQGLSYNFHDGLQCPDSGTSVCRLYVVRIIGRSAGVDCDPFGVAVIDGTFATYCPCYLLVVGTMTNARRKCKREWVQKSTNISGEVLFPQPTMKLTVLQ